MSNVNKTVARQEAEKMAECVAELRREAQDDARPGPELVIKKLRTINPVEDPAGLADRSTFDGSRYTLDRCTDGVAIRFGGSPLVTVVFTANLSSCVLGVA